MLKKLFNRRPSHMEIYKSKDNKWRYRVVAGNGKVTGSSQGYSTKSNAARAARSQHPGLEVRYE